MCSVTCKNKLPRLWAGKDTVGNNCVNNYYTNTASNLASNQLIYSASVHHHKMTAAIFAQLIVLVHTTKAGIRTKAELNAV